MNWKAVSNQKNLIGSISMTTKLADANEDMQIREIGNTEYHTSNLESLVQSLKLLFYSTAGTKLRLFSFPELFKFKHQIVLRSYAII